MGLCLLLACLPAYSQSSFTSGNLETQFLEPAVDGQGDDSPVALRFVELRQIELPGPLTERGLRLGEGADRFILEVRGGWARAGWGDRAEVEISDEAPQPFSSGDGWLYWGQKFRYRTDSDGWLVAQKSCRWCRKKYRRLWKLRVSGHSVAPPLVDERRIVYASMDNQIYGIRRRNGHRLWVADIGERVSRPLMAAPLHIPGQNPENGPIVILVVPDDGQRILALDALNGTVASTFTLSNPDDRLVGSPIVTPEGLLLVARQGYDPRSASVIVLALAPPEPAKSDSRPVIDYNAAPDSEAASPGNP